MELCTILIASTLVLAPVKTANYHTVQYFDRLTNVSNRVLDRSICKDIERVYPLTTDQGHMRVLDKVNLDRKANRNAVENHCKSRVRSENKNDGECRLSK